MSTAPTPPPPPQKPIRSAKWGLIVGACIIGLFVLLDLMTSIRSTAPPRAGNRQPPGAVSPSQMQSWETNMRESEKTLEHQKAAFEAAIAKAKGVDLSHLATPLPECNADMRAKLAGRYYVTATAQGEPVHLACGDNDVWGVIPDEAASIQPLTPQQQQALQATPQQYGGGQSPAEQRKQERAKRLEEALNSSSVALDFVTTKTAPRLSQSALSTPELPQPATTQNAPPNEVEKQEVADVKPKYPWDNAVGPSYRVFEGTVLETILTNRLNGEFTGPVNVMVTTDLYSRDHQHILMPQGTRILGAARKVTANEQRRLAVVFHRAIMPDGYSVDFDKFVGLDQQGAGGLTGRVNSHMGRLLATAVLVGAIGGLSEGVGFGYSGSAGPGTLIETGIGQQSGQEATQILNRALNRMPEVTVYEGTRVRILPTVDFELPAYENHRVSPNL